MDAASRAPAVPVTIADMTFQDLPRDWPTRPITDPRIIDDVLDLVVDERGRRGRCLAILVCDEAGLLLQPLMIDALPERCDVTVLQTAVDVIDEVFECERAGCLVIALGRTDGLSVTDDDRAWVAAARDAIAGTGWRLSSAHIVTLHGSRAIAA